MKANLKYVSSGDEAVMGISTRNEVFKLDGISESRPTGTSWSLARRNVLTVDAYSPCEAWGVNGANMVYHNYA